MPVDSVVVFLRDGENAWRIERPKASTLQIRRAIYGVLNDPSKTVDVTERLRSMVQEGRLIVEASNRLAGDPAPFIVKQLRVDYTINGEERTVIVREGEVLQIPDDGDRLASYPAELRWDEGGRLVLVAWQAGNYGVQRASGKRFEVTVPKVPEALVLAGAWEVRFPPGWGAPERVLLERLMPLSEHPDSGVRYFSGTATYATEFEVPTDWIGAGKVVVLDLGEIRHIAKVRLNGVPLGVLWKPPFRLEVSRWIKAGRNRLEVQVTDTWVNRLIGDEEFPDDCEWNADGSLRAFPRWFLQGEKRPTGRRTFTTWKHYRKGDPLERSGLIGPVRLIVGMLYRVP